MSEQMATEIRPNRLQTAAEFHRLADVQRRSRMAAF
jgi:hypothetical protein